MLDVSQSFLSQNVCRSLKKVENHWCNEWYTSGVWDSEAISYLPGVCRRKISEKATNWRVFPSPIEWARIHPNPLECSKRDVDSIMLSYKKRTPPTYNKKTCFWSDLITAWILTLLNASMDMDSIPDEAWWLPEIVAPSRQVHLWPDGFCWPEENESSMRPEAENKTLKMKVKFATINV